jgi:amidophosphoribosyltransferase
MDCGIVGIFSKDHKDIYEKLVHSLHVLQHRGEDACGILIYNKGKFRLEKRIGLVSTNFGFSKDKIIEGDRGIGHTRYPTSNLASSSPTNDIQPVEISYDWIKFYIAHNGTITSFCGFPLSQTGNLERKNVTEESVFECAENEDITPETAKRLLEIVKKEMIGGTDTETVGRIMAHIALNYISQNDKIPTSKIIEKVLMKVAPKLTGSYAFLIVTDDSIMGIRDPYGIRPLCFIDMPDGYVMASESCVMNELRKLYYQGAKIHREDVEPGTALIISNEGKRSVRFADSERTAFCIFEDAYFSRPDSNVRNLILSSFRERCGVRLGKRLKADLTLKDASESIIIPIPDGGIPFGVGLARSTGIPLMSHGLIRDKYTGRTFIRGPEIQGLDRTALVMRKLSFLHEIIEDKIVILADDSVVRGTTTRRVSAMAIEAGAKEVIWCFNFPPIRYICPLGIEMFKGGREQFIANKVGSADDLYELEKGIAKILGARSAYYLSLEDYLDELHLTEMSACTGCITGKYPFEEHTRLYGENDK